MQMIDKIPKRITTTCNGGHVLGMREHFPDMK